MSRAGHATTRNVPVLLVRFLCPSCSGEAIHDVRDGAALTHVPCGVFMVGQAVIVAPREQQMTTLDPGAADMLAQASQRPALRREDTDNGGVGDTAPEYAVEAPEPTVTEYLDELFREVGG